MKRLCMTLLLALTSVPALAQAAHDSVVTAAVATLPDMAGNFPELPPPEQVQHILQALPEIRRKEALLRAEEAAGRGLSAGTHEWNLSLSRQRRNLRQPIPGEASHFAEWDASLERGLRLPGKARLDEELAQAGIRLGQWSRADALHESARQLLADWFVWLREAATAQQWQVQVELMEQQQARLQRRHALGDASRLEALQAAAATAQATSQLHQATTRRNAAAITLQQRYPGLSLPSGLQQIAPQELGGSSADWLAALLEHDHELGSAHAATQRAQLLARRSDRERLPDPVLGLRVASERGGEERVSGLYLSFALPGAGRRAQADAELARADAAAQQEAAVLQKTRAAALARIAQAEGAYASWQASQLAAHQQQQAAELAARAYALGEGSLAESLAARRLALAAQLEEQQARLDALESQHRLRLDSHRLWLLDEPADENPAGTPHELAQD